jgi:hypothetical protein
LLDLDELDDVLVPVSQYNLELVLATPESVDIVVNRLLLFKLDSEVVGKSSVQLNILKRFIVAAIGQKFHTTAQR